MDSTQYMTIIAEEAGIPRQDLRDDTKFAELGIDHILAQAIADRFAKETTSQSLTRLWVDDFPDVQSFIRHLSQGQGDLIAKGSPLVLTLQGNPATAKKTLFLLPDGSGSGLAYARLPRLGTDFSLCALNSPFLGGGSFSTTIEECAEMFVAAIREAQPHGPYILGGWSAGGYFSTEVARILLRAGETIECIVLIDSPCRLEYESLPLEVVKYLAPRNLMGNWSNKETPKWIVDHFEGTLAAVAKYMPVPIEGNVPSVFIIEASDGIFDTAADLANSGLDQKNMLTRHLLGPRPKKFDAHGWERLYPRSQLQWARSSGNHFTLVHPPNSKSLGALLQDTLVAKNGETPPSKWSQLKTRAQ